MGKRKSHSKSFVKVWVRGSLILTLALSFMLLLSSSAWCATTSKIKVNSVSVKNNRLFDVQISITSAKSLTASTFTLEYDSTAVEFRSVSTAQNSCVVKATDKNGKATAIFLSGSGINLKDSPVLFTAKFKSIKSGNTNIKISASDCVNGKVKNFTPPKSATCKVTITGSASSDSSSGKSSSSHSTSKTTSSKNNNSNGSNNKSATTTTATVSEKLANRLSFVEDKPNFVVVIACVVLSIIAGIIFTMFSSKINRDK